MERIRYIDSHTGGEPTRVVIEGFRPSGAPLRTDGKTAPGQRRGPQHQPAGRPRAPGRDARPGANPARRGTQAQRNRNRPVSSLLGGNR